MNLTSFTIGSRGLASISFDLMEIPDDYPSKWTDFNSVAVNLNLASPIVLNMNGFFNYLSVTEVELSFTENDHSVRVKLFGENLQIEIDTQLVSVERVWAYNKTIS